MDEKTMIEAFAKTIVDGAMAEVKKLASDDRQGFGNELYYAIEIPYPAGSPEHRFFGDMLGGGSMKNPGYTDLFEQVITGMKQALKAEGLRAFTMLNCRFDRDQPDNFLLYILLS
ncbi:hypothetical protein LJC60_00870 [Ruminococcaceae bacterium OttesenSCG-928-D13]|nr:hypothetical protein [Ruminococcaceae bacterium OttesenSCG-928-D13]